MKNFASKPLVTTLTRHVSALLAATVVSMAAHAQAVTPASAASTEASDALNLPTASLAISTDPSWFLSSGHPNPQVASALQALASADAQGLNPADYDTTALIEAFAQLAQAGSGVANETQRESLNSRLTNSLVRYLHDVRDGRVDPHRVHQKFDVPAKPDFDARQYLNQALQNNSLAEALHAARPRVPMYDAVVKAMAQYRTLARDPMWSTPLPALPGRKLDPGGVYTAMPQLVQRLVALGDLPEGPAINTNTTVLTGIVVQPTNQLTDISTAPPEHIYTPAIEAGIKSFQERHGLTVDGIIGPATFAQLNVTPEQRVAQMALTLERLRWTPLLTAQRMVVVNVPEFVLRAYEVKPDGGIDISLQMKVIVGRALDTSTPLFDEDMRFIEFSPFWNVPPSIARGETLPRLRRDPGYFDRQGFEFVMKDGSVSRQLTQANLDAVKQGNARIRQRPGAKNALGDIKFIFPNNTNIYLHHTPAPQLFERSRRDFSHGCIRIEAPVALAQFVLQDEPQWTQSRIEQAMQSGTSQTIKLATPIPVVLAYSTVVVLNGKVYFFDDIYGHDKTLANALKKRG